MSTAATRSSTQPGGRAERRAGGPASTHAPPSYHLHHPHIMSRPATGAAASTSTSARSGGASLAVTPSIGRAAPARAVRPPPSGPARRGPQSPAASIGGSSHSFSRLWRRRVGGEEEVARGVAPDAPPPPPAPAAVRVPTTLRCEARGVSFALNSGPGLGTQAPGPSRGQAAPREKHTRGPCPPFTRSTKLTRSHPPLPLAGSSSPRWPAWPWPPPPSAPSPPATWRPARPSRATLPRPSGPPWRGRRRQRRRPAQAGRAAPPATGRPPSRPPSCPRGPPSP